VCWCSRNSTNDSSGDDLAAKPAPASVASDIADVPIEALATSYEAGQAAASDGSAGFNMPTVVSAEDQAEYGKLQSAGKPEVLYMGAEYCPHCANVRWPLALALSKFGTFSDLQVITSSESSVPTLSFVGSSFDSDHVAFTPIELEDQQSKPLEKGTDAQMQLLGALGKSSYPFVDFGGLHVQSGDSFANSPFVGMSHTDIASALAKSPDAPDLSTMPGQVDAVAGSYIAAICDLTGDQPAKVCKGFTTG
jgi:hypothetical protein